MSADPYPDVETEIDAGSIFSLGTPADESIQQPRLYQWLTNNWWSTAQLVPSEYKVQTPDQSDFADHYLVPPRLKPNQLLKLCTIVEHTMISTWCPRTLVI